MAAYRRVYDSRHLQADCQESGSAPEPYTLGNRVWATFTFLPLSIMTIMTLFVVFNEKYLPNVAQMCIITTQNQDTCPHIRETLLSFVSMNLLSDQTTAYFKLHLFDHSASSC